ncbi:hypothetical protein QBC39DRAFT_10126 [Podospora conica]|nr:hypothetical protein QBC39DRAFT_10126 [Schizothecium conicum]
MAPSRRKPEMIWTRGISLSLDVELRKVCRLGVLADSQQTARDNGTNGQQHQLGIFLLCIRGVSGIRGVETAATGSMGSSAPGHLEQILSSWQLWTGGRADRGGSSSPPLAFFPSRGAVFSLAVPFPLWQSVLFVHFFRLFSSMCRRVRRTRRVVRRTPPSANSQWVDAHLRYRAVQLPSPAGPSCDDPLRISSSVHRFVPRAGPISPMSCISFHAHTSTPRPLVGFLV